MLLASKQFTLGDTVQYTVDYREHPGTDPFTIPSPFPIRDGDSITTATVTSSSGDTTISGSTVYEGHKVVFKLGGGVLNETFTVTVSITTNNTETFIDTIVFNVVSP